MQPEEVPEEALPVEFAAVDPDGLESPPAHEPPIDEEEGPEAHGAAFGEELSPEYEQTAEQESPLAHEAPVGEPTMPEAPGEPAPPVEHPELSEHDAASTGYDAMPAEYHGAPTGYDLAPADYSEAPTDHDVAPPEHDPSAVEHEGMAGDAAPAGSVASEHVAATEPERVAPVEPEPLAQAPSPGASEPEAQAEEIEPPEPVILERRGERTRARRRPPVDDPEATQGYEIPGLPPEEPAPPPRQGLPEPPPRVGSSHDAPMRRAFDRSSGRPGAVGPVGPPRERARRGIGSRLAALVALAAVAVAVVLLVHSLKGHSKTKGPLAAPTVKVLIPEGKTRLQIAQIAKAAGLKGSYRAAARRSVLLNPANYGAPKDTPDLEGFLFPATYDMDKGGSATRLVEEQLTAFQEHFGEEETKRAKALGVTPYGLLTVASMVEREAQVPGDRSKIAAVIYNRLKAGMPLGIDAAIYYAVESAKNIPTYTGELTESQLQINSPYNTRTHTGLPPTPISNPGVASIQAAAHPAHASYLYYVAGADGCGEQVFSASQSEFETNVAAYEEAKRKNGGKPPVCKKKH